MEYAFEELGLHTVYADCVHRNKRSQHVLEKIGFVYSHEDDALRYYVLKKKNCDLPGLPKATPKEGSAPDENPIFKA